MLEVTVVGEAWLRFEIEPNLDVVIFHFQRPRESRQRSERALSEFSGLLVAR
jgi:hypothetical protein